MALLLAMAALADRAGRKGERSPGERIAVLTVDHGLRRESVTEVRMVESTARALGVVHCLSERVTIDTDANLLAAAREARYHLARSVARRWGIQTLAVAHQAEDRAESLFLALERGDGLESLARLRPRRVMEEWDEISIARPLLGISRADLRQLLTDCDVEWVEDPSNAQHARGAMRGDPSLASLVERVARGMGNLADETAEFMTWRDQYLAGLLNEDALSCSRPVFDGLPPSFRRVILLQLVHNAGSEISRSMVEKAASSDSRAPRRYTCTGGIEVVMDARTIRVERVVVSRPGEGALEVPVTAPASTRP